MASGEPPTLTNTDAKTICITIDGIAIRVPEGTALLKAIETIGISLPALCFDERMAPSSSCRLCQVEIEGRERASCACATPATEGMVVRTRSPALEGFRRAALGFLARSYPPEALQKSPEKPFHRFLKDYGVTPGTEPDSAPSGRLIDLTHPYIRVDMRQCISCYRCIRICEEVQGQYAWKKEKRGGATLVLPNSGGALAASSCVSCGACADTCPTGALEDISVLEKGAPSHWVRTTCPYCGTGCELDVGVREDRIVTVRPVKDSPVSKGHLCVKGRYSWQFVDSPERVTRPMIRLSGRWVETSWEEALREAARMMRQAREVAGPDSVAILASSRATNEESYLAQKLARFHVGTNNVDCCARVCHGPSAAGLGLIFGTGAATNSFDDIERTQAFLIVGTNATENHPIVGDRIRQRILAGIPAVVIDPRRTELASIATVHLQLRPGTNLPLLNALAREILHQGWHDPDFISRRTEGFEDYSRSLEPWTLEKAAEICGVEPALIHEAARLYAQATPAMMFHGLGVTEHIQGTDGVLALAQLALLTGNVGKPGAGVNPLRGQNNVQGTANMGCEPARLTGYQKIEAARELHERVWGRPIPATKGLSAMTMMDAASQGKLKSLLLIGYDLLLSHPNLSATREALSSLDSLIIVDLFLNRTAQEFGHVFLPACSSFEKDGTFMNSERRIQKLRPALRPRGESKTDLEILKLLARELGETEGFAHADSEAVWNEIRAVWPAGAGISYERIEKHGIQWPCPNETHPGTEVLHGERFPIGEKARLRPLGFQPSSERISPEFPMLMNSGRSLFHFNAATMTGPSRNRELRRDDLVQLHPEDARRVGVATGDRVRVKSRHGEFTGVAEITAEVRPGELFTTFHAVQNLVNLATGTGRDPVTDTPEYKVTAARIERLPPA
ncbi:MAG: formate dehydrogenase subunit alpha [Oligoflexia bacterium]|nr:formate dehydrogenase subunit alpha [Oligoflexia bacterium]